MTQETAPSFTEEAATPTETPAAPTQEAAPATETPEATPTEPEAAAEEAPAEPQTFAEIMTGHGADDSPFKEDLSRYNDDQQGQGWQKALDTLQPQMEQNRQRTEANAKLYDTASQALTTIQGRVEKAVQQGTLTEEALGDAIKSNPAAWSALQSIGESLQQSAKKNGIDEGISQGSWTGAEFFIKEGAAAANKPSLAMKYQTRINEAKQGRDESTKIVHDFITEIRQGGYDAGLASKAAENKAGSDVAERKGQKPPQGVGSAGSNNATDRERLLDPNTPVSELIEIRARQTAG